VILAAAGWQAQRKMTAMIQADRLVTQTYIVNEHIEHFLMALQTCKPACGGMSSPAWRNPCGPTPPALPSPPTAWPHSKRKRGQPGADAADGAS